MNKIIKKQNQSDNDLVNIKNYKPNEADFGKRVLCLYRVSTDKQVSYNENNEADIPMQRRECRRFIEQQGWVLVHEEREDGVSGHKVRADKRDSIQGIKELVTAKKFDIFLVFMFDRIGRIADETPFVVEWLVRSGVRVWSAKEGEQRFDNHADKLMNYIRFWQADGESEKTSIRTKSSLGLLVEDGHYKGGNPPYGYTLVKSGRLDKKKNEKKNLAIIEEESVVVKKIFDLYVQQGYGTRRIATTLTKEGIKTRAGKNFAQTSINSIIRNLTYTGVLRSGESRSPVIEELQIIPTSIYKKAQDIMEKRNSDAADARTYPMNTKSRLLLIGKAYCADCGSRLIIHTTDRFTVVDGVKVRNLRYTCYGKYSKRTNCQGQTGYSSSRLDNQVDGVIRFLFERMQNIQKSEVVASSFITMQHEQEARYTAAQREYSKKASELNELKAEVLKSIRGESKFAQELLNELITQSENELTEIEKIRNTVQIEMENCKDDTTKIQEQFDEVISWTELYDVADISAKKMIIANLINRVEVGIDYQLHIDLNINIEHFNIQLDYCSFGHAKTA
jgi:DNA invertase Pin-like site-specific DNA recombinase